MSNPRMVIIRLGTDEATRLRAIRLRALRDAPYAFGTTFEESEHRPLSTWTQQLAELPTFVAVDDGIDVGMVRGGPHDANPDTAYLLSMWVASDRRRKGVGQALVDALIDWARGEGFANLVLDVADDNLPAIALYARKGFEATGVTGALPPPRDHVREHERALEVGR